MKIAVIGECFRDVYYLGSATALSPEAPIPCVKVFSSTSIPGGAGNVAANVRSLGAGVLECFQAWNVPIKSRLIVGEAQLARWDENDYCLGTINCDALDIDTAVAACDAIIVSDYGKGLFTSLNIQWLEQYRGKQIFVDTKRNPDLYQYLRPTYFPNRKEFSEFHHAYGTAERVVYKQGELGISYIEHGHTLREVPAASSRPRNVSGAGDTVIAAFAVSQLRGMSIKDSLEYAALAAAVTCNSLITAAATPEAINALRTTTPR